MRRVLNCLWLCAGMGLWPPALAQACPDPPAPFHILIVINTPRWLFPALLAGASCLPGANRPLIGARLLAGADTPGKGAGDG